MKATTDFDAIIIGGSYAGLSAAMSLGRSLRKVLIIDSGRPCNSQTPHSHNFLTQDGNTPAGIANSALEQVLKYSTVRTINAVAVSGRKTGKGFAITTDAGTDFTAAKLVFATGIIDKFPAIDGFDECWGISVIHCPYCHGYEVRKETTGLLANGDVAFEKAKMISNWTNDLTLFTNGGPQLTAEQTEILNRLNIKIIDTVIRRLEHTDGYISNIVFHDGTLFPLKALYAHVDFEQASQIPEELGCEINDAGRIKVDGFQKTTVEGIFACGDNATMMRSVASAVATGSLTGAMVNRELTEEAVNKMMEVAVS